MNTHHTPKARHHYAQADAYHVESNAIRDRLAASKRYRGRANDIRALAKLDEAIRIHTEAALDEDQRARDAERAEYDAWEQEDIAATQRSYEAEQAFRQRVATRAYFAALNGERGTDEERWLRAEAIQRAVEASPTPKAWRRVNGADYYDA